MQMLATMSNPWRYTWFACSLLLHHDPYFYSSSNGDYRCAKSTIGPLSPISLKPKWESISIRKQERELIHRLEYMPNSLNCRAKIYKHHLEMKAKFHHKLLIQRCLHGLLLTTFIECRILVKEYI